MGDSGLKPFVGYDAHQQEGDKIVSPPHEKKTEDKGINNHVYDWFNDPPKIAHVIFFYFAPQFGRYIISDYIGIF